MYNPKTATAPARVAAASIAHFDQFHDSVKLPVYASEERPLVLHFTPVMRNMARYIALARTRSHDGIRKESEDLGALQNLLADVTGVTGEVVLYHALENAGFKPDYTLLSEFAPSGPDFTLDDIRFHVKTVPFNKTDMNINEHQRIDPRYRADFYVPLRFLAPFRLAVYAPVPFAVVASWPLRKGRSAYRSIDIRTLRPLTSLLELGGEQR